MKVGELENYIYEMYYINTIDKDNIEDRINKISLFPNGKEVSKKRFFNTKSIRDGKIGLMCPYCYHTEIRDRNINIYTEIENNHDTDLYDPELFIYANIKYFQKMCPDCGEIDVSLIEVDPNIVKSIGILNRSGFRTKFCCEGHSDNTYGYIYFSDKKIIPYLDKLPITWYLDIGDIITQNHLIIRSDEFNRIESILDLNEWVKDIEKTMFCKPYTRR